MLQNDYGACELSMDGWSGLLFLISFEEKGKERMSDEPTPYKNVEDQLILRDHLAADRTILANERTFLAYIRTALTLFVAGLSFVHFKDIFSTQVAIFSSHVVEIIGIIFILLGIATFFVGLVRYRRMRALICKIKQAELQELEGKETL